MAPASASILPAANAGAKRPASAAAVSVDAEHPLAQGDPQDGVAAGKNSQGQPQQLECPRCKSCNTKFCYYNNYSTTQPRHFCRACRRYWTQGGTLRNVPVGGACRRGGSSGTKHRRSAEPSRSSISSSAAEDDACRTTDMHMLPPATPFFPFLSDGAVFLPQFDLGLGASAAASAGFPWTQAPAASDLYDGLGASWGGGGDGTLAGGPWDDFATGLDLTWPPPPAAGN